MISTSDGSELWTTIQAERPRVPMHGQWELTYRCNLKCVMCYTECFDTSQHIRHELALDDILRIVDELAEAGVMALTLTGGEPLARRDFARIYEHIARKGIQITVFTNATLIDNAILELWSAITPFMVEVSLHGLGADFDRITAVPGSYKRCLERVRWLSERQIPILLKTVGMTINREQILEIKRFAESTLGVTWYLGEEMRPELNGSEAPLRFQLPQEVFGDIAQHDQQMWTEHEKITRQRAEHGARSADSTIDRCGSRMKFHIDPYGGMQLCSGNRRRSYDLRRGTFREGFFGALATFPCPNKSQPSAVECVGCEQDV